MHVEPGSFHEQCPHRDTPSHLAAFHGCLRYLIEKALYDVECKNRFESTPFHRAVRQGQLHVVYTLIEDGKSDPITVCM